MHSHTNTIAEEMNEQLWVVSRTFTPAGALQQSSGDRCPRIYPQTQRTLNLLSRDGASAVRVAGIPGGH